MGSLRDLTGQVFGRLTVIVRSGTNKDKKAVWLCRCACGNTKEVLSERLCLSNNTRSCGCLKTESQRTRAVVMQRANVKPGAARNKILWAYRDNARKRSVDFFLSLVEFDALLGGLCHYCGAGPSNEARAASGELLRYNGIDRVDPTKGYTGDNCVSCCRRCNWMKCDSTAAAFISHVAAINKHQVNLWTN